MPKHNYFMAKIFLQRKLHIPVTIGTRKYNNPKFHVQNLRHKDNSFR